jgi:hypothetical protein
MRDELGVQYERLKEHRTVQTGDQRIKNKPAEARASSHERITTKQTACDGLDWVLFIHKTKHCNPSTKKQGTDETTARDLDLFEVLSICKELCVVEKMSKTCFF